MKGTLVFVFLMFLLKHKVSYATIWTQKYSEPDLHFQGFTLESSKVDTIFECYRKCEDNIHCASINMNLADKTCELKYSTKTRHPEKKDHRQNMVYMKMPRDHIPSGMEPGDPIESCKKLKKNYNNAKSGIYWMKFNESSSAPFQVFCDMTTDGGGWTLVYSYTFSKFDDFHSDDNNITPVPNWPLMSPANEFSPVSTTIPLNESSYSAMEFSWWKKIGNEFLLKCNITNWVACVEGTGSLVNWVTGSLTCRVVKAITPTCTTIAPDRFEVWQCGPAFKNTAINNYQFILDAQIKIHQCRPFHDPCAEHSENNHLKNVSKPGCALYVR